MKWNKELDTVIIHHDLYSDTEIPHKYRCKLKDIFDQHCLTSILLYFTKLQTFFSNVNNASFSSL